MTGTGSSNRGKKERKKGENCGREAETKGHLSDSTETYYSRRF